MDQICADLLTGSPIETDESTQAELVSEARMLSIRLEFIAGLSSPEEDHAQRMQYQVDRLAASMSGDGSRLPVSEEASEAEAQWLSMYALPEAEFKIFGKRIKTALSTITES